MTDDARLPDELGLLPADELWTLLEKYPLPRTKDGKPAPGSEELHRAFDVVYGWMWRREVVLRSRAAAENENPTAFGPARSSYGLCPECQSNDGYLWLMERDEYWAVCHAHRSRWQIGFNVIEESFVPDGTEEWEDETCPISQYRVVSPIEVNEPKDEEPRPPAPTEQGAGNRGEAKKPELRIVRPAERSAMPRELDAPNDAETAWEAIRQILYILFVGIPWLYLREIRETLFTSVTEFFLTDRQRLARRIAEERGWYFLLPSWMK